MKRASSFRTTQLYLLSLLHEVCHLSVPHSFCCLLFMKCVIFPYHTLLLSPLCEECYLPISHSFYCLLFYEESSSHITLFSLSPLHEVVSSFHATQHYFCRLIFMTRMSSFCTTLFLLSPLYEVCHLSTAHSFYGLLFTKYVIFPHTHVTVSSLWSVSSFHSTLILMSPLYEVCHLSTHSFYCLLFMKCVIFSYTTLILLSPLYEVSIPHSFYCLLFMKCVIFSYTTFILLSPLYEVCHLFIYHIHFTVSSLWSVSSFHIPHSFYCLLFMKWVYHTHFTVSSLWSEYTTLILLSPLYEVCYLAVQGAGWWWWWWGWTEDSLALAGGTRLCFHPGHNLVLPSWHHSIVFGQLQVHTLTWRLLHAHMTLVTRTRDACYTHTWCLLHTMTLVTPTHTRHLLHAHMTHVTAHMMLVTRTHDTWHSAWQLTSTCDTQHKHEHTHDKQQMTLSVCMYVCVCLRVCR